MEPKFKVGDLVQHRASFQRAVILSVNRVCTSHTDNSTIMHLFNRDDCIYEFSGTYDVSTSFEDIITVEEYLLMPFGSRGDNTE